MSEFVGCDYYGECGFPHCDCGAWPRQKTLERYARACAALGSSDCYGFDADLTPHGKAMYARWLKADAECARLGISEVERIQSVCLVGGAG
jgi:hypothetical protein